MKVDLNLPLEDESFVVRMKGSPEATAAVKRRLLPALMKAATGTILVTTRGEVTEIKTRVAADGSRLLPKELKGLTVRRNTAPSTPSGFGRIRVRVQAKNLGV